MNFYTEPLGDLLKHFDADPQKGLNQAQLEQARQKYGKNVLREQKKPSLLMRFLAQFKDTMIIILIIAAIISFFVAAQSGETREFLEPALILAIVILNAIMGMMQESKAERPWRRSRACPPRTRACCATAARRSSTPATWCRATSSSSKRAISCPRTRG